MPAIKRKLSQRSISMSSGQAAGGEDEDEYEYGGWPRSPTPEEDWSQYENENGGEWPVDSVVGEDIDLSGNKRYQIKWTDWHRANGTDTTWQWDLQGQESLINKWNSKESKRRKTEALEHQDIDVDVITCLPHTIHTKEAQVAYKEKVFRHGQPDVAGWDDEIEKTKKDMEHLAKRQNDRATVSTMRRSSSSSYTLRSISPISGEAEAEAEVEIISRASTVSTTQASRASTIWPDAPDFRRRQARSDASSSTANEARPSTAAAVESSSSIGACLANDVVLISDKRPMTRAEVYPSSSASKRNTPSVLTRSGHSRSALEDAWNYEMRKVKAAPIRIVNDVDNEIQPPLTDAFIYLENRYKYAPVVRKLSPKEQHEFLTSCECRGGCNDPGNCACQHDSGLTDDEGNKMIAYDAQGLFLFNNDGKEVVECNKRCSCDTNLCRNRVAQKPRDVEIEIFKTIYNGWGARATVDLPRGKVLGLYTGLLMRRQDADAIPPDSKNYIFDLDTRDDDEQVLGHHSVHAKDVGNWTRFVNHSCDPTASVYSVIFQSTPQANTPYIAFVANQFIPARKEITIDYHPQRSKGHPRKNKSKLLGPGKKVCLCGAAVCRGWM